MKWIMLCLVGLLLCSDLIAQEETDYAFNLLRQDDEFTFLKEKESKSFYENFKLSSFSEQGTVSFGGSYRGQFELFANEEFEEVSNSISSWYLQRLLLHSAIDVTDHLRLFAELGSSVVAGKEHLSPVDRDELYLNQFFVSYKWGRSSISLGRENLKVGSRRLVDPREGPNVRRSFDQIAIDHQIGETVFNIFYAQPVSPQEGIFDNRSLSNNESIWGIYGAQVISTDQLNLDAYYLGNHYSSNQYEKGIGRELRNSVGVRAWRSSGRWAFDHEAIVQFGTFSGNNIFAWTVSVNAWRRLKESQKIGLKTELISGDGSENSLGTFNPLYPRGAYFGRVARFGPSNLIDIHPYWNIRIGRFMMELDYDIFWRYSTTDAVYDPALNIVLTGNSNARFIAQQFGTLFNYEFSPFMAVELETNFILVGDYIEEVVEEQRDLFHAVITVEMRF